MVRREVRWCSPGASPVTRWVVVDDRRAETKREDGWPPRGPSQKTAGRRLDFLRHVLEDHGLSLDEFEVVEVEGL